MLGTVRASKENLEAGRSPGKRLSNAQFNLPRIMECGVSYNVKAVETSDSRLSIMQLQLLLLLPLTPSPLLLLLLSILKFV
jgi:hypothetical protein